VWDVAQGAQHPRLTATPFSNTSDCLERGVQQLLKIIQQCIHETPGGSYSMDSGGSRDAKRIRMRLQLITQLMAVLGSFTAGEMAFKAMSTIAGPELHILAARSWRARSKAPRKAAALQKAAGPLDTRSSGRRPDKVTTAAGRGPSRGTTSPMQQPLGVDKRIYPDTC